MLVLTIPAFIQGVVCGVALTLLLLYLLRRNRTTAADAVGHDLRRDLADALDQARADPLTGLGNRRLFDDVVQEICNADPSVAGQYALLLIDIDQLKSVNDQHGHLAGDTLLRHVADRIRESTRALDRVIRLGGDEFVVVVNAKKPSGPTQLAERIRTIINGTSASLDGTSLQTTVSIGITRPTAGDTPDSLFARADRALFQAKEAGRNCLRVEDRAD